MPKVIDLTGQRFGKLVVLHEAEREAGKRGAYWLCQCDCGNTKVIYGGDLRRGRATSCGCNPVWNKIDLTGQRFGKLVVLREAEKEAGKKGLYWICQCDCGNTAVVHSQHLRNGMTQSCGCKRSQNKVDMTGKQCGKWTVLRESERRSGYWVCQCECGNIKEVSGESLRLGQSVSCGCMRLSEDMTGQRFGKLVVLGRAGYGYWSCRCDCGNIKKIKGDTLRKGKAKSCGCTFGLPKIDLTGQRFGMLTALRRSEQKKHFWVCQCDCGNIKEISQDHLQKGTTKSCGCNSTRKIDMTGQRFGKLTVLREIKERKGYWMCQCECGRTKPIYGLSLRKGTVQSCGCDRKKQEIKYDLTGQRFGMLTVLHESEQQKNRWICRCDCGNTKEYSEGYLRSRKAHSCGCDRKKREKKHILAGQRFGMLTVLHESEQESNRWICRCDCGNEKEYSEGYLRSGKVQSCGCTWKRRINDESTIFSNGVIYVASKGAYRASIHYQGKYYQLRQSKNIDDCIAIRSEAEKAIENGNFLEWYERQRHTFRQKMDFTGQRFGMLTVLKRSEDRQQYWICRCDCGNEKEIYSGSLQKNSAYSCGCVRRPSKKNGIDLTGQRFGKLTVIRRSDRSDHHGLFWLCRCDCGNEKEIKGCFLRAGKIKSCGCLRKNKGKIDLTGQRFGKLTVLHESEEKKGYWMCQCDCGNIKEVKGVKLRYGQTKTCGCLTGNIKYSRKPIKSKYRIYYPDEAKPIKETASGVSVHSLGFMMQYIRERRNMTAQELSRHCNVTRAAVKFWENNLRNPDDDKLEMVAEALNVDVSALYDRRIRNLADIIHILFEIAEDGCILPDENGIRITNDSLRKALAQWADKHEEWKAGRLSNEEYYDWQDAYTVADLSEKEKMEEMKNET